MHKLDLIQVEHVLLWVDSDEELRKNSANQFAIKKAIDSQQITGRMLLHLNKQDLMRMGLAVHSSGIRCVLWTLCIVA